MAVQWLMLASRVLVASSLLLGCSIKEDREDVYNELDRLRILGIASDPAQPAPEEEATFRVLAYDPQARPRTYQWSWCPAPGAPQDGFRCALEEEAFAELWRQAFSTDPPSYDLGSEPTANFTHSFSQALVEAFCQVISEQFGDNPDLILQCIEGLQPSVSVRVTAGDDELVAWREMSLIYEDLPAEERNHNPDVRSEMKVVRVSDGVEIEAGGTLHRGELYRLEAGLEMDKVSEMFVPEAEEGLPEPEARQENVEMRWLVTAGTTSFIDEELGGDERFSDVEHLEDAGSDTDLAAGFTEFEDFVRNFWYFPRTDPVPETPLELFLVARDERDGIGWTSFSFEYSAETLP